MCVFRSSSSCSRTGWEWTAAVQMVSRRCMWQHFMDTRYSFLYSSATGPTSMPVTARTPLHSIWPARTATHRCCALHHLLHVITEHPVTLLKSLFIRFIFLWCLNTKQSHRTKVYLFFSYWNLKLEHSTVFILVHFSSYASQTGGLWCTVKWLVISFLLVI